MTTPADELRQAAAKLRAVAANATEGAWAIWRDLDHQGYITVGDAAGVIAPPALQSSGECNTVAHVYVEEDAEHIATMHPGVGLALADWLDALADMAAAYPEMAHDHDRPACDDYACDDYACDVMGRGIAVARQVLGTTDQQPTTTPVPVDRAAEPSAAVVRKKLRRWAYAAGHIESELDGAADRMYELIARDVQRRMADEAQQPETKAATEEQIVREHVTTVHLIGEQLEAVESWLWERLAEVREAASAADQPDTETEAAK